MMIEKMMKMQEEINCKIDPEWREARHPWHRAIWMECAELQDHLGWKWWKHQEPDIAQARMEVVDIWHFILSMALQEGMSFDEVEGCIQAIVHGGEMSVGQRVKNVVSVCSSPTPPHVDLVLHEFASLRGSEEIEMSMADLFELYVVKNKLNEFRQSHGYKTGGYKKMWGSLEDNVVATGIFETHGIEELTERLEREYAKWN